MLTTRIPTINFRFVAGVALTSAVVATFATAAHAAPVTPQQLVDEGATGVQLQYTDGKTARDEQAGSANTHGTPIQNQSHFRAGSVSKAVVSTAVLQLAERGKISLDAPIETYLPGKYTFGKDVTVRQILGQTSGLATAAYESKLPYDAEAITTLKGTEEFIQQYRSDKDITSYINQAGLSTTPGSTWQYSNANYFIASQIVSASSRMPYQVYIHKNIFKPLNMKNSSFVSHRLSLPWPYTRGYQPSEFYSGQPGGEVIDLTRQSGSMFEGSGNLVTTTGDLNTFMKSLSSGAILSQASLTAMQTPIAENPLTYGLGLMQTQTPCGTIRGHSGNVYGYTTASYYLGKQAVSISVTEGTAAYGSHSENALKLAFESLCPEVANQPVDDDQLKESLRATAPQASSQTTPAQVAQ